MTEKRRSLLPIGTLADPITPYSSSGLLAPRSLIVMPLTTAAIRRTGPAAPETAAPSWLIGWNHHARERLMFGLAHGSTTSYPIGVGMRPAVMVTHGACTAMNI